eukprot:CFRG3669T1
MPESRSRSNPASQRSLAIPSQETSHSGNGVDNIHISRQVSLQLRALKVDDDSPVSDMIIQASTTSYSSSNCNFHNHSGRSHNLCPSVISTYIPDAKVDLERVASENSIGMVESFVSAKSTERGSSDQIEPTLEPDNGDDMPSFKQEAVVGLQEPLHNNALDDTQEESETGSVDLDVSLVDPRVADCLIQLNKATDDVDEIEGELEKCKERLFKIIADGDINLLNVQRRLGMQKSIDRAKLYYKEEQRAVDAQEVAAMVELQHAKVVKAYEKARLEQSLCEKQLEKEIVGNLNRRGGGGGVSVVIDLHIQEALNNAAMSVQECRMEWQRVNGEQQKAIKKAKEIADLVETMRTQDRASLDKAQIFYDTREIIANDVNIVQKELERRIQNASKARLKVAQCLQMLQDMSKETANTNRDVKHIPVKPTPTPAVEEIVTSGRSNMSFSAQRRSLPNPAPSCTHYGMKSPVKPDNNNRESVNTSMGADLGADMTASGQHTNRTEYGGRMNAKLEVCDNAVGNTMHDNEVDIDITDSPSLLGRQAPLSPSFTPNTSFSSCNTVSFTNQ